MGAESICSYFYGWVTLVLMVLVCLFALAGNMALVMCIIKKHRWSAVDILLLCMSCVDFIFLLIYMPLALYADTVESQILHQRSRFNDTTTFVWDHYICCYYAYTIVYLFTLISVERLTIIRNPSVAEQREGRWMRLGVYGVFSVLFLGSMFTVGIFWPPITLNIVILVIITLVNYSFVCYHLHRHSRLAAVDDKFMALARRNLLATMILTTIVSFCLFTPCMLAYLMLVYPDWAGFVTDQMAGDCWRYVIVVTLHHPPLALGVFTHTYLIFGTSEEMRGEITHMVGDMALVRGIARTLHLHMGEKNDCESNIQLVPESEN